METNNTRSHAHTSDAHDAPAREGRYFGELQPIHGQWIWPMKHMEEGDWFRVDHMLRDPEKLRRYVYVRGAQLGKSFSFKRDDPDAPGFSRVTCTVPGMAAQRMDPVVEYGSAMAHIAAGYGVPQGELPELGTLEMRDSIEVPVRFVDERSKKMFVFSMGHMTIAVRFLSKTNMLRFVRVPEGVNLRIWRDYQRELDPPVTMDDVMS